MKNLILEKEQAFVMFMVQTSKKNDYSTPINDFVAYANKSNGEITVIDRNTYLEDGFDPEIDLDFYKTKNDIINNPQDYIQFPEKPYRYPEIDDIYAWKILESWAKANNIIFR